MVSGNAVDISFVFAVILDVLMWFLILMPNIGPNSNIYIKYIEFKLIKFVNRIFVKSAQKFHNLMLIRKFGPSVQTFSIQYSLCEGCKIFDIR